MGYLGQTKCFDCVSFESGSVSRFGKFHLNTVFARKKEVMQYINGVLRPEGCFGEMEGYYGGSHAFGVQKGRL